MENNKIGYINDPKNIDDCVHNINFQLECIEGYMSVKDYAGAKIKLGSLNRAFEKLHDFYKLP